MSEWKTFNDFLGYQNKKEKTNLPPGVLIAGSQNVVITDDDLVSTRLGYTLDGAANAAKTPVESSFDWNTSTGVERNLRAYDDELEIRISTSISSLLSPGTMESVVGAAPSKV